MYAGVIGDGWIGPRRRPTSRTRVDTRPPRRVRERAVRGDGCVDLQGHGREAVRPKVGVALRKGGKRFPRAAIAEARRVGRTI